MLAVVISIPAMSQEGIKSFDSLKIELSKFVAKTMKNSKVEGLSLALVDNQEIVWAEGFGFADKANKVKATSETIYRIGSISKLFTGTAIMQLSEIGLLNIDNPIQTYIPEFSIKSRFENPGAITPRNILTHHSGLPNDIFYQGFTDNPDPISSIIELLNQEYTCTQPNTIHSYSNAGYELLGALVERVSGEDFYSYTSNHLFGPMEMKNSSFRLTPEMESYYSKGYANGKEFKEPLSRCVPDGMLHSNVLDIANFIKMTFNNGNFNGNQIIKTETLREMQTRQNADCKLDFNHSIGLTWELNKNSSLGYVGGLAEHGGDIYVYHGQLRTFTDHKIGIIVLVNTKSGGRTSRVVANTILQKYLEHKTGIKPPKEEDVKVTKAVIDNELLKAYAGTYSIGPEILSFNLKKGNLETVQNSTKLIFWPNSIGSFSITAKVLGFIPIKVKNQHFAFKKIDNIDYMIYINKADTIAVGWRITKTEISDTWRARLGSYEILNDNYPFKVMSDFSLIEKDGFLYIETKVLGSDEASMVLRPVTSNQAVVEGIGRNTGATVSFNGDEMSYAGFKMRKKVVENQKK